MKIKLTAKTKENLGQLLESILNTACVVCTGGNIPTKNDMEMPMSSGRYWCRENDKYHLFPMANNHWMGIYHEEETSCVIEFRMRYDHDKGRVHALTNLILAFFAGTSIFEEEE